jgi:pimeloyl-ACP methyl ester carboxylesterase
MLLPRWRAGEPPPPVYLHLAATGDHGFARRRRLAKPLVEKGIGAVILENPFYGLRRPPRQIMSALRRASDQLLMNYLTIEEARALLGWFHRRGFRHLGVTGYSMGGYMAAYIASLSPVPVTPVPCAAGNSPAAPYLQSSMSRIFAWSALGEALEGGAGEAREHFEELIAAFTVDALPQPERVDRAIIIASKDDAIVPPHEAVALHEHWDGSKIRWLPGGHMTSYMLARESMRRAMYDAMHDTMYR